MEVIIVTSLLGLVATVVAAAFVTIVRVGPTTQYRIDDARSVRALQSWLVRDIASTPPKKLTGPGDLNPGGFVFSDDMAAALAWLTPSQECGAGGNNVLYMAWTDASTNVGYYANYRLVDSRVTRTLCSSSGKMISTVRLAGDVSTAFCASSPSAYTSPTMNIDPSKPTDVVSVEVCVRSLEDDTGLNAGGGNEQDIALSISSRNYYVTP